MEPVGAFLDLCRLARKQTHRNLTVFALLGEKVFDPDYLLLETALAEGLVEIRELGPGGSVPELRLVNRAERPVLVVEGEELVGAKQNRAVNVTILVAAGSELVIPVSCVEQRRWHYRSEKFSSGAKMMHSSLRRAAREGVRFSMSRGAGYRGDQGRKSLTDLVACTVTYRQRFLAACARLSGFPWKAILVEATFKDIRAASNVSTSPRMFTQMRFAALWTPSRPSSASHHLRLDGSRALHRARRQLAFQAFHLLVVGKRPGPHRFGWIVMLYARTGLPGRWIEKTGKGLQSEGAFSRLP